MRFTVETWEKFKEALWKSIDWRNLEEEAEKRSIPYAEFCECVEDTAYRLSSYFWESKEAE